MIPDVSSLYSKYGAELDQLAYALRPIARKMDQKGEGVIFGDTEGEVLYMLLRESKPELVFEISPNAGWSTNYLLAALTANGKGHLHSFELIQSFHGVATEEVIRGNQLASSDQSRLKVHVGDALKTTETVPGTIDFLMLDSCHDAWFAEWYTAKLFPRCRGLIFVQDIAFVDRLETSTEASYFWKWAGDKELPLSLVGSIEADSRVREARNALPERVRMRSNSIIFDWPASGRAPLPELTPAPETFLVKARQELASGNRNGALRNLMRAVNLTVEGIDVSTRYRLFLEAGELFSRLDERPDSEKMFKFALSSSLAGGGPRRAKALPECLEWFVLRGRILLAAQAAALVLFERAAWKRVARMIPGFPVKLAKHLFGRNETLTAS